MKYKDQFKPWIPGDLVSQVGGVIDINKAMVNVMCVEIHVIACMNSSLQRYKLMRLMR